VVFYCSYSPTELEFKEENCASGWGCWSLVRWFARSLFCLFVCLFDELMFLLLSCCSFGGRRWKCQRVAALRPPRAFSFRICYFPTLPDNSIIALALLGGVQNNGWQFADGNFANLASRFNFVQIECTNTAKEGEKLSPVFLFPLSPTRTHTGSFSWQLQQWSLKDSNSSFSALRPLSLCSLPFVVPFT